MHYILICRMVYKKYIKRGNKFHGPYIYKSVRVNGKVITEYIGKHEEQELRIPKKELEKASEQPTKLLSEEESAEQESELPKKDIEIKETKTNLNFLWLFLPVLLVLIFFVILLFFLKFPITPAGRVSLEIEPSYQINETISGNLNLNFKHGELIPKNSVVKISLGSQQKEIALSELIILGELEGNFYAENIDLEGQGLGYGFLGKKISKLEIEFELLIYKEVEEEKPEENITEEIPTEQLPEEIPEQPAEEVPEEATEEPTEQPAEEQVEQPAEEKQETEEPETSPITGEAVKENKIYGKIKAGEKLEYNLEQGEKARIIEGSVKINNKKADDSIIKLEQTDSQIIITTDYQEEETGFGSDFLTEDIETISISLEKFDLIAEPGSLNIEIIYNDIQLISSSKEIKVEGVEEIPENITTNITEINVTNITEINITTNITANITIPENITEVNVTEINITEINITEVNVTPEVVENITEINITIPENITERNITVPEKIVENLTLLISKSKIKLGLPVKWKANVKLGEKGTVIISLPSLASNINVFKITGEAIEEPEIPLTEEIPEIPVKEQEFYGEEISGNCTDTDKGMNYNEKGILNYQGKDYEDYCYDENRFGQYLKIAEYYCDIYGKMQISKHKCENTCEEGRCVKIEEKKECKDSDSGLNYAITGTACIDEECKEDICLDDKYLSEAYCIAEGEIDAKIFECPYKCENGKCIEKPKIEIREKLEVEEIPKEGEKPAEEEIKEEPKVELEKERTLITAEVISGEVTADIELEKKPAVIRFFIKFFRAITGRAVSSITGKAIVTEEKETIRVTIRDNATEYDVEYDTPMPISVEKPTARGKLITISAPDELNYTDVVAYTYLEKETPSEKVKLYHLVNYTREEVFINKHDLNNNSLIDFIEWIVPHLSNETYELVIEIIKAEHLDENRTFISDIYNETKEKDDIWSEVINNKEYVRVVFEQALTKNSDITLYARSVSGNSEVGVYRQDGNETIAVFEKIKEEGEYKVYLSGLNEGEAYDTFDLRISKGKGVEIDYIVDPVGDITTVLVESTNAVGQFSSIAVDSTGIVHISEYDSTISAKNLRYCNNSGGTWTCLNVDTTNAVGSYSSIALDSNNKAHISHYDATNTSLKYCNNTAGTWSCETLESTNTVGQYSSIALDSNDKSHISYFHDTNTDLKYCNNTAGTWSCVAVVASADLVGQYSSIALDSNNKVHISYYQGSVPVGLNYCNNTGGDWSCAALDSTVSTVGEYSSIALDSNNKVHISYHDNTNTSLKYCNNTAGNWSCGTVESTNTVGLYSSIALDSNNKAHISHWDDTNDALRYCNNTGGTWSCRKLVDTGIGFGTPNGRWIAIKKGRLVDSVSFSDYAHMSWYNSTGGDLYYTNISIPAAASDTEYPQFYNFTDMNSTYISSGQSNFSVNINSTNGTIMLEFNGSNFTASNTSSWFNISIANVSSGTWSYYWLGWGNGTSQNYNVSAIKYYTVNASAGGDTEYPIFSSFSDNNATYSGQYARFNVSIVSTNGTTFLTLNGTNYTANNLTATVFNVTTNLTVTGNYNYTWSSYGNGTSKNYNITALRWFSVNSTILDTTPPTFSQVSANKSSVYHIPHISVDFNATDTESSISSFQINYTEKFNISSNDGVLQNITSLGVGIYQVNVSVNDTANNFGFLIYTVEINQSGATNITLYINGTTANATITSNSTIWLNATLITGGKGYLDLYKNGTLINNASTSPAVNNTNFTDAGNFNITAFFEGNENYTANWTYKLWVHVNKQPDITSPTINITYPLNSTYNVNVSILNYTYSDANPSSCWYSINNGTTNSTSVAAGLNFTSVTSYEGSNNWSLYCNDSSANNVSSSVTFFKDSIKPQINITTPINNTKSKVSSLNINYTVSDTNLQKVWWTNNSGTTNWTLITGVNITNQTWIEGNYNVIIHANDTSSNQNSTAVNFTIDTTTPQVTIISPITTTYSSTTANLDFRINEPGNCTYTKDTYSSTGAGGISMTANSSYTGFINPGETFSNEPHELYAYCNDSAGNLNNSVSVTFTISSSPGTGGGTTEECEDDCTSGQEEKQCVNITTIKIKTCGNYDIDKCLEWSNYTFTNCNEGEECVYGKCSLAEIPEKKNLTAISETIKEEIPTTIEKVERIEETLRNWLIRIIAVLVALVLIMVVLIFWKLGKLKKFW